MSRANEIEILHNAKVAQSTIVKNIDMSIYPTLPISQQNAIIDIYKIYEAAQINANITDQQILECGDKCQHAIEFAHDANEQYKVAESALRKAQNNNQNIHDATIKLNIAESNRAISNDIVVKADIAYAAASDAYIINFAKCNDCYANFINSLLEHQIDKKLINLLLLKLNRMIFYINHNSVNNQSK